MPFLPAGTHRDAGVLITTRGIRGFSDGLVSLSVTVGTRAHGVPRRTLLFAGSGVMMATGLAFGVATSFAVLLVVGVLGTLNPTAGDVSVFLPLEQSMLAGTTTPSSRTALYARYTFIGGIAGAMGSLAIRIPERIADRTSVSEIAALRWCFAVYALAGVAVLLLYRSLDSARSTAQGATAAPLGKSRRVVFQLAALFSLDSFGGGFVVQSLLALWLFRRFDLSVGAAGTLLFVTGTLSAASGFVAAWLAARIGLVRTMVFTHLPANCFLIAAAFMPSMPLAVAMLVLRSLLSSMDVPARTSYVMAVVSPEERAAAASVTNVPRSLAGALPPTAAGWMLDHSTFGWPLVLAGACKIVYDLLLLRQFQHVRPEEETDDQLAR
ncbi:MAG: MFS transporter [Ilumatobacteraceae bacterium]